MASRLILPRNVGLEIVPMVTGTFLSGAMMSLFLLTIPVILETTSNPSQLLHQWHRIFYRGHLQGPLISLATGLLYCYSAYLRSNRNALWRPFVVSAGLTVGMIPFTWIFMARVNGALFKAVEGSKTSGADGNWREAETLVKSWGQWNAIRALFPLSGAILTALTLSGMVEF